MRNLRWLALLAVTAAPLTFSGCVAFDGILSACVYEKGYGPCDENVPRNSCESGNGIYYGATSCDDLGMRAYETPPE